MDFLVLAEIRCRFTKVTLLPISPTWVPIFFSCQPSASLLSHYADSLSPGLQGYGLSLRQVLTICCLRS